MLPVKIPLKVFLDIGTYAEAWKKDAPPVNLFMMQVTVILVKESDQYIYSCYLQ